MKTLITLFALLLSLSAFAGEVDTSCTEMVEARTPAKQKEVKKEVKKDQEAKQE
jgi:hypothetical protein